MEVDIDSNIITKSVRTLWNPKFSNILDSESSELIKPLANKEQNLNKIDMFSPTKSYGCITVIYDIDTTYILSLNFISEDHITEVIQDPKTVEIQTDLDLLGKCLTRFLEALRSLDTDYGFIIFSISSNNNCRRLDPLYFTDNRCCRIIDKILKSVPHVLPVYSLSKNFLKIGTYILELHNELRDEKLHSLGLVATLLIKGITTCNCESVKDVKPEKINLVSYSIPLLSGIEAITKPNTLRTRFLIPHRYKLLCYDPLDDPPRPKMYIIYSIDSDDVFLTDVESVDDQTQGFDFFTLHCTKLYILRKSENEILKAIEPQYTHNKKICLCIHNGEVYHVALKEYHTIMFSLYIEMHRSLLIELGFSIPNTLEQSISQ